MLAIINVIAQVMSNAAIEKIVPLKRKCDSNNSLLSIWVCSMGSSFFGGMAYLGGLDKSSTNRLACSYTKLSVLVVALVITFFVINIQYLDFLPKFVLELFEGLLIALAVHALINFVIF
ncbi:SulP family inorganic anion transporter [Thiomicrospira sp. R3]|uniref:SulP family inorganic anion transporter n=1 Tax=Thiomicrospira sp. R3 TaxID=3035472 RepID=UPI00259B2516|nr:SulP family inorganic anion transporter [Thiomicrospira sp. R3]WFE69727.1 SulP family inorganic anion transporter [Thiomicrospira sp. R3]